MKRFLCIVITIVMLFSPFSCLNREVAAASLISISFSFAEPFVLSDYDTSFTTCYCSEYYMCCDGYYYRYNYEYYMKKLGNVFTFKYSDGSTIDYIGNGNGYYISNDGSSISFYDFCLTDLQEISHWDRTGTYYIDLSYQGVSFSVGLDVVKDEDRIFTNVMYRDDKSVVQSGTRKYFVPSYSGYYFFASDSEGDPKVDIVTSNGSYTFDDENGRNFEGEIYLQKGELVECYFYNYSGYDCVFSLTTEKKVYPAAPASCSLVANNPFTIIESSDYRTFVNDETGEEIGYYYYDDSFFSDMLENIVIVVVDINGIEREYKYSSTSLIYSSEEGAEITDFYYFDFANVNCRSNTISVCMEVVQSEDVKWCVGIHNFTMSYKDFEQQFQVNIINKSLESISFKSSKIVQLVKDVDGCLEKENIYDSEPGVVGDGCWFKYSFPLFDGDILTLKYDNGEYVDFIYDSVVDKFIDSNGNVISGNDITINSDQSYENQWQPGSSYEFLLSYMNQNTVVSVEIFPCEHNWLYKEELVERFPTCVEDGFGKECCEICENFRDVVFSSTGHINTMWVTEQDPTCTEDGYKDEWCLDCGEIIGSEEISAIGHNEGEWFVDVQPTCTETGLKHCICSDCGDVVTEVISANGHSYSEEWTIDVVPTCTEEGSKSHHCTVCEYKSDVTVIEALGHIYSTEWTIDITPTCTEEGSKSHHCTGCDEYVADVTVISPLGHDYKIVSIAEEHPHTNTFNCSRCPDTKEEEAYSENCGVCNFSYTNVDDETCKITGYIGSKTSFVLPGTISGRIVTTTTTGAFKNNTTLTSVKIEDGVQGLGSLAFLGCSSLSKVVIPESVTTIGTNAFYNCASDFTIYCYSGSYAMQYAIDNSLNYVVMDIAETENTKIDYVNKLIITTLKNSENIEDIIYIPSTSMAFAEASLISGNNEYLGTGSIVTVFDDNNNISEYTLVVEGDTNGDSVCNVLDVFDAERASNGHVELTGAYAMAADSNSDDIIDINDYQAIVNKALAS